MTDKHEISSENSADSAGLSECKKEVDAAYEVLGKEQAEYDKHILTLSATFLGLSVAFVKDIVPLNQAVAVGLYDWAISLLFASIVFVLGTYQYSIHGHFALIDYWNEQEALLRADLSEREGLATKQKVRLDKLRRKQGTIRAANVISGLLFIIAVLCLVRFVVINISQSSRTQKETSVTPSNSSEFNKLQQSGDLQRGANIKLPAPAPQTQQVQTPSQPAPQHGGGSNGKQ